MTSNVHAGPDFAALEKSGWAEVDTASEYAQVFARASDFAVPILVAACGAAAGVRALDICCGQGNVTQGLARAGAAVTGLDFSPAMLAMATQRCPK